MQFEVCCPCGRVHAVQASQAGSTLRCGCGVAVPVPLLSRLRAAAGLAPVDWGPEYVIRTMLRAGQLPPAGCVGCGAAPARFAPLLADCERQFARQSGDTQPDTYPAALLYIWLGMSHLLNKPVTEQLGRDIVVPVPVRVCPACRALVPAPGEQYAALLTAVAGVLVAAVWGLAVHSSAAVIILAITAVATLAISIHGRLRQRALRKRLRQIPPYAALLEKYPEAMIFRSQGY